MRRTTLAMTVMILGVSPLASTVSAQQTSSPAGSARAGTAQPDVNSATSGGAAVANSTVYGMTTTRSARYLLRNGLDYLNYQQYERALKFLRDAETRKQELNDAEKLALKQGIERAQRGMREAADADAPYALSERTTRRRGFTAGKPAEQAAPTSGPQTPSTHLTHTARTDRLGTEDQEPGQPIRLTSTDSPGGEVNPSTSDSQTDLTRVEHSRSSTSAQAGPDQPASMPVIPKLQVISPLPDPTELTTGTPTVSLAPAPATIPAPPAQDLPQPAALNTPRVPTTSRMESSSTPVTGNTPVPSLEVTPGTTSSTITLSAPDSQALPLQEPANTGQQASSQIAPAPRELQPVVVKETNDLKQVTTRVPTRTAGTEVITPTHREWEDPAPVMSSTTSSDQSTSQTGLTGHNAPAVTQSPAGTSTALAADTEDTLPALPSEPARGDSASPAALSQPAAATATSPDANIPSSPSRTDGDELPPLPADLSQPRALEITPGTAPESPKHVTLVPQPETVQSASRNLPPLPGEVEQATDSTGLPHAPEPPQIASDPPLMNPRPLDSELSASTGTTGTDSHSTTGSSRQGSSPTTSSNAGVPSITPSHIDDSHLPVIPPQAALTTASSSTGSASDTMPPTTELPALPDAAGTVANSAGDQAVASPHSEAEIQVPGDNDTGQSTNRSTLPGFNSDFVLPHRAPVSTSLRPEQLREVEEIARRQENELRQRMQNPPQPTPLPPDTTSSDLRTQTQLDISRAPSPAEARPIKAIPVPEDWVPLPPRRWAPQRKYWAAAATCHLPLYFQDPVLERYGHSVEQFVGPVGRYLSYPVDDPTQSTQRNQLLQPFFSAGLFGLQIIAWPYNLIMDPPWEAQYDLGYYRPGDNIPTDLYWLPLHGYGPPLHGSNY